MRDRVEILITNVPGPGARAIFDYPMEAIIQCTPDQHCNKGRLGVAFRAAIGGVTRVKPASRIFVFALMLPHSGVVLEPEEPL